MIEYIFTVWLHICFTFCEMKWSVMPESYKEKKLPSPEKKKNQEIEYHLYQDTASVKRFKI